jgi:hypothetical protein
MYNNYGFNPYYSQQKFQPMANQQPPQYIQPIQQPTAPIGLLGKIVDSIEVVKAMDIPLDGSISYFPLTDGSAIISKQLQNDGTSKTIVYKPIVEDKKENQRYVTMEELQLAIEDIDLEELQDIKNLKDEFKSMKKEIKELKSKLKVKEE